MLLPRAWCPGDNAGTEGGGPCAGAGMRHSNGSPRVPCTDPLLPLAELTEATGAGHAECRWSRASGAQWQGSYVSAVLRDGRRTHQLPSLAARLAGAPGPASSSLGAARNVGAESAAPPVHRRTGDRLPDAPCQRSPRSPSRPVADAAISTMHVGRVGAFMSYCAILSCALPCTLDAAPSHLPSLWTLSVANA